ncbi:MAG: hypothetical protein WCF90_07995 [Methanomicrobiales archaeon]
MSAASPEELEIIGFQSMLIPTTAINGEIFVNCYIIYFLLISIPSGCALLADENSGQQACGIETGAYTVAGISAILILYGVLYLVKWHFSQKSRVFVDFVKTGCGINR